MHKRSGRTVLLSVAFTLQRNGEGCGCGCSYHYILQYSIMRCAGCDASGALGHCSPREHLASVTPRPCQSHSLFDCAGSLVSAETCGELTESCFAAAATQLRQQRTCCRPCGNGVCPARLSPERLLQDVCAEPRSFLSRGKHLSFAAPSVQVSTPLHLPPIAPPPRPLRPAHRR